MMALATRIGGEDPGGLVLRCAEAAGDVGQGDVAMEESSTSMKVARVTVMATTQGLIARTPGLLHGVVVGGRVGELRVG